jgi:tRNA (Thr-GGU) A37 N-methylase
MHRVAEAQIETGARHPREHNDWPKVGILAQPARSRPNRIGVTAVELIAVDGLTLRVRGLDAVDGTPVLDIKPYITGFAPRGTIREPAWAKELMASYW